MKFQKKIIFIKNIKKISLLIRGTKIIDGPPFLFDYLSSSFELKKQILF